MHRKCGQAGGGWRLRLKFPSAEFDEIVAGVCHGSATDDQLVALHELLRINPSALDEYILRVELHSRLASEPDLFLSGPVPLTVVDPVESGGRTLGRDFPIARAPGRLLPNRIQVLAFAAGLVFLFACWWGWSFWKESRLKGSTSNAVAMLNRTVDAIWDSSGSAPVQGAPLAPGKFRLKSGLAQIVFYSGARIAMEGPAAIEIQSAAESACHEGRFLAEIPAAANGFVIRTPGMEVFDRGSTFGLVVKSNRTELHAIQKDLEFVSVSDGARQKLREGAGVVVEGRNSPQRIGASANLFSTISAKLARFTEDRVLRLEQWQAASRRLDEDPTLLVHFDFEASDPAGWRLWNSGAGRSVVPDATLVGCQWSEGRWPEKRSLEFRGVSDRVRLGVSGEFDSLTLATWVRVHGLDRQFNSLFMSDGFEPGTLHWLIRHDGVMGLTVIGSDPGDFQILRSPPVITLDQFGAWLHLAVVVDGPGRQVVQYVNGLPVSTRQLKISPPYRVGSAELGNWNSGGFTGKDPALIRNFSGAMDEFALFRRALSAAEIQNLHAEGKP